MEEVNTVCSEVVVNNIIRSLKVMCLIQVMSVECNSAFGHSFKLKSSSSPWL